MKIIPRFFHAVADYFCGVLLLLAPNFLGFADVGGAAAWIPRIVGLLILGQAIMTNYELGLLKLIPVAMHLMNDYAAGAFLLAAPWLFRFSALRMPSLMLIGVGLLVLGLTTMTQPAGRPRKVFV